jgi:hypothetical protein
MSIPTDVFLVVRASNISMISILFVCIIHKPHIVLFFIDYLLYK